MWVKACWPDIGVCHNDIIRSLSNVNAPKKHRLVRPVVSWICPSVGALKFNVDGSYLGKPGPAGVGCLLRDHTGHTKICFSNANYESNSKAAVGWVLNLSSTPWRFRNFMAHIENLKNLVKDWSIAHVLKERNEAADTLAKEGVNRVDNLVVVVDD
ncbi:hypothetical protein DITRI_Ditri09bG0107000 [Diplodiscus trichospermus]